MNNLHKRKHLIITGMALLIIGIFLGATGFWYLTIEMPHKKAVALAKQQQDELKRMVRTGQVVTVKPDEIVLRVEESGEPDQAGKEITYKADDQTRIQPGRQVINPNGGKIDLTKCVSVGKTVNLMVKGEKIITLHWETTL